jgi:hypothetical protein
MRGLVTLAAVFLAALGSGTATSVARADDAPAAEAPPSGESRAWMPSSAAAANAAPLTSPAAPDVAEDPTLRKVVSERRAGIVIGVAPGIGFAGASGYPNNARLVGNGEFYSQSPLLVGTSTTYFLMGALTDYVSFGPMVNIAKFESDSWKSTGVGIGFRVEAFPLVKLFPMLADSSIYGQAGVGSTELQAKGNYPSADGTQSFAGIGLHHEFRFFRMLGGHVSGGPYVEYDAIFATSAERHWASAGFRIAWYGGTVAADKP